MIRDFTLRKYQDLLEAISNSNYSNLNVHDYLTYLTDRSIILRHDVDRKPYLALKMAQLENEYDIKSTYYFRMTKNVFQPEIIKQIAGLGHETGYHYEALDKANGDVEKAIGIFETELKEFRKLVDVTTICMHGNPLTSWVNRDMWQKYDFKDFGIIGEAYISIDYSRVSYFTDTGRAWNNTKRSIKDITKTNIYNGKIGSTDELIGLIKSESQKNICVLTHPNRWTDNFGDWLTELVWQNIKNAGKSIIKKRKVLNGQDN